MIKIEFDNNHLVFRKRCSYIVHTLLGIAGILPDNDIRIFCGRRRVGGYGAVSEGHDAASEEYGIAYPGYDAVIDADWIQKIIELISCSEEYDACKDDKGRFPARYSKRISLLDAEVNRCAIELRKALERSADSKGIRLRTAERSFTVVLSHDADNITDRNPYVFLHRVRNALKAVKRGKFAEGIGCLLHAVKRCFEAGNPYWDFEALMKLEEYYGYRSSFYFINGKKGRYGARYNLKKAAKLMRMIDASGWEVALHTNFASYQDASRIREEKEQVEKILGKEVYGCRNHYLRFEVPDTWKKLNEAGLRYDTTLGYSDAAGFRAGAAFPFLPYDMREERVIGILEIPLVIMDGTLFEDERDWDRVWENVRKILDAAREVNGTLAVNFHSGFSYGPDFPGWQEVYIRMLDYIHAAGGRGITARQLYEEIMSEKVYMNIL